MGDFPLLLFLGVVGDLGYWFDGSSALFCRWCNVSLAKSILKGGNEIWLLFAYMVRHDVLCRPLFVRQYIRWSNSLMNSAIEVWYLGVWIDLSISTVHQVVIRLVLPSLRDSLHVLGLGTFFIKVVFCVHLYIHFAHNPLLGSCCLLFAYLWKISELQLFECSLVFLDLEVIGIRFCCWRHVLRSGVLVLVHTCILLLLLVYLFYIYLFCFGSGHVWGRCLVMNL